jgi:hypothetical protein
MTDNTRSKPPRADTFTYADVAERFAMEGMGGRWAGQNKVISAPHYPKVPSGPWGEPDPVPAEPTINFEEMARVPDLGFKSSGAAPGDPAVEDATDAARRVSLGASPPPSGKKE